MIQRLRHQVFSLLLRSKLHGFLVARQVKRSQVEISNELRNVVKIILSDNFSQNIRITYNTSDSPDTYADIIPTLMLVRFFASIGRSVEFVWDSQKENHKKKQVGNMKNSANSYLRDQSQLIKNCFEGFDNITLVNDLKESTVFFDLNLAIKNLKRPIYRLAPEILDGSVKHWLRGNKQIPKNFFLDAGISRNGSIAIVFRASSYDKSRNPSIRSLKKDINLLTSIFPNHKIVVFTDKQNMNKVFLKTFKIDLSKNFDKKKWNVIPQSSSTYSDAVFEILKSDFLFQRKGGGMCVPVLHSQIPYLVLDQNVTYHTPRRRMSLYSFSKSDQMFTRPVSRHKIKSLIATFVVHNILR